MSSHRSLSAAIAETLKSEGAYIDVLKPLHIADVEFNFDFDAVLAGPAGDHALVFISDLAAVPLVAIERRVRALSLLTARTDTTCPFTLVLIAQDLEQSALARLEALCRVICVYPTESIKDAIAPLLPLRLPSADLRKVSALQLVQERLDDDRQQPLVQELIRAAGEGPAKVQEVIIEALDAACAMTDN